MRLFKILLLLGPIAVIGMLLYLIFFEILARPDIDMPIRGYVYISIAFTTATLNIVYHIVSFQFYKAKERVNMEKKIPKVLWIGGICFASFTLFIGGASLYSFFRYVEYEFDAKQFVFLSMFLGLGLLSFLELSLLKRRIKQLQKELETKDDIDTIGKLEM